MRHTGTRPLASRRLLLRPFILDDARPMFEGWAGQPRAVRWLRWQAHRTWAESAEWIWFWMSQYPDPEFYQWAVTDRSSGRLLGSASLYRGQAKRADWVHFAPSPSLSPWEAGLCLSPAAWGQGLGEEALALLCRFWQGLGADFLGACCCLENQAAARLLEKAGFRADHTACYTKYDGSEMECRVYGRTLTAALQEQDHAGTI